MMPQKPTSICHPGQNQPNQATRHFVVDLVAQLDKAG